MLTALLIHELFHLFAAHLAGEKIVKLELTPFGGIMYYQEGSVPSKGIKGILVHAAGPIGNYSMLLALSILSVQQSLDPFLLRSIVTANISMLILNLLPALPLDGGQIVFCIGYYLFPIASLAGFLCAAGIVTGFSGLLLSLYGLCHAQTINFSLLIVSLYLIIIASKSRVSLLSENIYAVIQERLANVPRIRRTFHYHAAYDTALYEFIPLLKSGVGMEISFTKESQIYTLTESVFCQGLLSMPSATLLETWRSISQYKEKKPVK